MPRDRDQTFLRRKRKPNYAKETAGTLRVVDLFCGCGGMSLGFAEAARERGYAVDLALSLDTNAEAIRVHRASLGSGEVGDVISYFPGGLGSKLRRTELDLRRRIGRVDVLLGGPPCQGNSDLNNHTRRADPRNALYAKMARAAEVLRPRAVIIETVATVVHDRNGVVRRTAQSLRHQKYRVCEATLSLVELGVPQMRRRHILVASKIPGLNPSAMLAGLVTHSDRRSVGWAIEDLLGQSGNQGFDAPASLTPDNRRRVNWLFDHDEYVLADSERPPCHRDKPHSYKSVYGRMRWHEPANTITTGFGSMGQGCYVHPRERRLITPHEAARLQTFPDFFGFRATDKRTAWARLIGNAVPPLMMLTLGRPIVDAIDARNHALATRRLKSSAVG